MQGLAAATRSTTTAARMARPRQVRSDRNRSAGARGFRWTANTADRHVLYERSVQDPDAEIAFIDRVFRSISGRKPQSLREDFCGTALLCARWIERHPDRTATGVDLDSRVLRWSREHHLARLNEPGRRVVLLQQDVRAPSGQRFDVIQCECHRLFDQPTDLQLPVGRIDLWPVVVSNTEELIVGGDPRVQPFP